MDSKGRMTLSRGSGIPLLLNPHSSGARAIHVAATAVRASPEKVDRLFR